MQVSTNEDLDVSGANCYISCVGVESAVVVVQKKEGCARQLIR